MSPGLDHVVHVDEAIPEHIGRVLRWDVLAAGKGVNVARSVTRLGAECVAYTLVGESDEQEFVDLIEASGTRAVAVAVPGATRRNLTLLVGSEAASHAAGPRLKTGDNRHADALIARVVEECQPGDIVTFNGAVPDNIRESIWAEAACALQASGVAVVADVQGDAMIALLKTGLVKMAKPNAEEALVLGSLDAHAASHGTSVGALYAMVELGVADPIVTIGSRGALHLTNGQVTRSWCPGVSSSVVVGAGDAFVAGYCTALGAPDAWPGVEPVDLGVAAATVHVTDTAGEHFRSITAEAIESVRREQLSDD